MLSAIAVPAGTYPGFGGCDCVLPRSVLDRLVFFCRCDRPVARVQCGTAPLHVKVIIIPVFFHNLQSRRRPRCCGSAALLSGCCALLRATELRVLLLLEPISGPLLWEEAWWPCSSNRPRPSRTLLSDERLLPSALYL